MSALSLSAYRIVAAVFGEPRRHIRAVRGIGPYVRNLILYWRRQGETKTSLRLSSRLYPCLSDRYDEAGVASGHYFHQDIWAARRIHVADPATHHDVGSRIDGFVAHLLCFRDVVVIDIRPLESSLPGLDFVRATVLDLPFADSSFESISCLHAMEHVGLGRYGDAIDPQGWSIGMRELARVLAPDGHLYFSVPTGRERLEFDAHRVFSPQTVLDAFAELRLVEFSAVDDDGRFWEDVEPQFLEDARYGCGLYLFQRPARS